MFRSIGLAFFLGVIAAASVPMTAWAGEEATTSDKDNADKDKDVAKAPIEEKTVHKNGSVTVAGKRIDYVATAGTLTIRNAKGEPTASMFYVAYTTGQKNRPVTFLFNGGPGSASLWLHMGSFGPVHVETPSDKATGPAPFRLSPNEYSLLDTSDLVFLDAIGTGYSRPLAKAEGKDFWGVDGDIKAFADAICRYLTINERWNAPKFLLGESYGTTRAAGLSLELLNRGANLNGVVLLSSFLNAGIDSPGYDQSYIAYLPSFAATAWYHRKLANRPSELKPFLEEVRAFAAGPYLNALAKGDDLSKVEAEAVAEKISAYTGLSKAFILKCKLRVDLYRFQKELLRDEGLTVGRFDSRFTGVDTDTAGEGPEYDAADAAISGAYIAAINSHLASLGYKTDLQYRTQNYEEINAGWDWKHRTPQGWQMVAADTAADLGAAMRQDPHLKVLSLNGYYDMATPFFATEYDLKHMRLDPDRQKNLSFTYYESGHMIYIRPDALAHLRKDLGAFYASAK